MSAITNKPQRSALEKQVAAVRQLLQEYDEPDKEEVVLGNAAETPESLVVQA